jgi:hypothetical protein
VEKPENRAPFIAFSRTMHRRSARFGETNADFLNQDTALSG